MKRITLSNCPTATIHLSISGFEAIKSFRQLRLGGLFTLKTVNPVNRMRTGLGRRSIPFSVSRSRTLFFPRKTTSVLGSALPYTLISLYPQLRSLCVERRVL